MLNKHFRFSLIALGFLVISGSPSTTFANSSLAAAAMRGDIDTVKTLLKKNADVNESQGDGTTALHWAAYRNDPNVAELLIGAGANISAKTRLGDLTPLLLAAKNGNTAVIKILLKAGTDVNLADRNGTTPLMYSAASGSGPTVKLILESGADVDAKDQTNGQTALMFASAQGRTNVVRILAASGADLNVLTELSEVVKWKDRFRDENGNAKIRKNREEAFSGGLSALHFAARERHLDVSKALVESGANVNLTARSDDASPLTTALINGSLDIASFLIDQGADPNLANKDGVAPLYALVDAKWAERTWYPAPKIDEEKTGLSELVATPFKKWGGSEPTIGKKASV